MGNTENEQKRYERKLAACTSMTELLLAMSAWQSFADGHGLTPEERASVDAAYLEAEKRLLSNVKQTPW